MRSLEDEKYSRYNSMSDNNQLRTITEEGSYKTTSEVTESWTFKLYIWLQNQKRLTNEHVQAEWKSYYNVYSE